MRKKILSVFLTLALLSTTFPAGVLATEPGAEPDSGGIDLNSNNAEPSEPSEGEPAENPPAEDEPEETPPASPSDIETVEATYQIDPEDFPFTNDELFAGYVNDLFGIVDPYGISTFSTGDESARYDLTPDQQKIYDELLQNIEKVLAGTETSTVFAVTAASVEDSEESKIIEGVVSAIMLDHPYEMFWYDKTSGYRASSSGPQGGPMTVRSISMAVAQSYSRTNTQRTYETDASKITAAATAKAKADQIVRDAASKATPYEKLLYFKQQICDLVSYNNAAASNTNTPYGDPWQMIYVFDGDDSTNVVCEGYAKAFQYLCDQAFTDGSVQCYTVSGTMSGGTGAGGHMWNIITLEDGNYLVDVTNCDTGTVGAPDKLFLVGVEPNSNGSYTFSANGGTITYTYDNDLPWGNDVLTLSNSNYSFDVTLDPIKCNLPNGDIPLIGDDSLFAELGGAVEVDPSSRVFIVPTDNDSREISFETTVMRNDQPLTNPDCEWTFVDYISEEEDPGLTFTHNKNTAKLTISKRALININTDENPPLVVATVSVSYGGNSAQTFPIVIYRRQSEAKSIEILKDGQKIDRDRLEPGTRNEAYTARVLDQYGEEMTDASIEWSSSNEQVFTVNENGRVTVVTTEDKGDSADLIAECGNIKCELPITISSLEPYDLSGVQDVTLTYGSTARISGIPTGATATYTPANRDIVTVDSNGMVTPLKVGETKVTVTVDADTTHSEASKDITVTVNKADIANITTEAPTATIKANDEKNTADKLKDAINLLATVTVAYGQGKTATLPVTWTASASNTYNVKGGTYTWTGVPTVGDNFNTTDKTLTATLTVTPVKVTTLALNPDKNTIKTTDSTALVLPTATLNITCDPADVSISDITVNTWKNGDADFTLEALKTEASNLTADKELTLTPVYALPDWATLDGSVPTFKLTLTSHTALTAAMVEDIPAQTYDGSAKTPAVTVKDGDKTLTVDTDYTVTYSNNTNAGTATVTIIGKGDYSGSIPQTFTISPKQLADNMIADIQPQTLTNGKAEPVVVATDNQKTLVKDTDYTVEYSNNTAVGTGTVTITGKGNYTGTASKDFTITNSTTPVQKSFTVADIGEQKYTGSEIKPIIVVRDGSKTLVENTDYTVAYSDNVAIGTATVTITGIGDYDGTTKTVNFKIIANTFTVENLGNRAYTGDAIEPKVVVKDGDTVLTEGTDYTVVYSNNTNVGTATVTITGIGKYAGDTAAKTVTRTFEITAPSNPVVSITVTDGNDGLLAGKLENNKILVTGLGNKDTVDVSLTLMKGLTQETSGNTITVKSGNTTIATYTIDTTGVEAKVKGITIEEGNNPDPEIDSSIPEEVRGQVEEAVNNTEVEGLINASNTELQKEAEKIKTERDSEIKENLKLNDSDAYKLEVKITTEIAAKELNTTNPAAPTFKLEITPKYTITAVKESDNTKTYIVKESTPLSNEHIKAAVTVSVKMPETLIAKGTENWFARHFNSNGSVKEILKVTVKDGIASWQQNSFSEVELFQSDPITVSFPGFSLYEYNVDDIGEKLPEPEKRDGYTFDGWQIEGSGAAYKTVTEDFLKNAAGKTFTAKFTKNETPVTPPDNPNPSTPSGNTGSSSNGTSGTSSPALKPLPDRNHGTTTPANPTTPSNPSDEHSFTDVPANHWAAAAIDWVSTQGLMNGISDTQFAPNRQTTRQQLWMILARLNGTSPANMAEARTWAMNNGISDGTNAVQNMSRQQMVTFLYRYAQQKGYQLTGSADLSSYSDSSAVAGYAREALAWAVANGIVNGTSQTTLSPTGTATRAQFATILQRFYNSIVNQ